MFSNRKFVLVFCLVLFTGISAADEFSVDLKNVDGSGSQYSANVDFEVEVTATGYGLKKPRIVYTMRNSDASNSYDMTSLKSDYECGELHGGTGNTHPDTRTYDISMSADPEHTDNNDWLGIFVTVHLVGSADTCGASPDESSDEKAAQFHGYTQTNNPPTAAFNIYNTPAKEGERVHVNASPSSDSDGSIGDYAWDFGGTGRSVSGSTLEETSESWSSAGTYDVTLTVTDEDGGSNSVTNPVTIEETCNYYGNTPYNYFTTLGEDANFELYHNDASDCESVGDVKFEVCGTNLTSTEGYVEGDSVSVGSYSQAYNVTFNTESDVSCSSSSNTVQFYNGDGDKIGKEALLSLSREETYGTPIHDNGNYTPDSEIIVATEMSRASFYNPSHGSFANRSETFFFACRGDYRGENISASKLVKVQEGSTGSYNWQHYRCAMNGSWMEAECEPGMELRYDGDDERYECFLNDPETITATYFNIQDIPYSGRDNGYLAGFKIPEAELNQYEQTMGIEPQKVDAECWMGEDNERPTNPDDSVVFTSTYSGNGDLWAIGEIEGREGVNNETYSCVWGMKNVGSTADTNVYESTNNNPLLAKDGGKEDITYDRIETIYAGADIDEGTPRDVWQDYKSKEDTSEGEDERSYISGTDEFMLENEVPYCESNSYWASGASVLDNIICQ